MPALPSVPKVLKIAHVWGDGTNEDIVTRLHVRYTGTAPTNTDLDTMMTALSTDYAADLGGAVFTGIDLLRLEATDLSSPTGAIGLWAGSIAGTRAGPPVPVDAAVVTSYVIARRYRGGHSRGYWPIGVAGDLDTPQLWLSSFIGGATTSFDAWRGHILGAVWSGGGTLDFVSVSYYSGFTVVTNPITGRARNVPTVRGTPIVDSVSSYVARLRVGTQRRRLQYG